MVVRIAPLIVIASLLVTVMVFGSSFVSILPAYGHGVPEALQGKLVRIDDETFSPQTVQTGQKITVSGVIVNQVNEPLRTWISLLSDAAENNGWEITSRDPANVTDILPSGVVHYALTIKPLKPGLYHVHTQLIIENGEMVLGPGQTIFVKGDALNETSLNLDILGIKSGGKQTAMKILSSSTISRFSYDENTKQISFSVSGDNDTEGTTITPVGIILQSPYFIVTVDGKTRLDYQTTVDSATGETFLKLTYSPTQHDITISGVNALPEFSSTYTLILLIGIISVIAVSSKTALRLKILR